MESEIVLLSFPAIVVGLPFFIEHLKKATRAVTQWIDARRNVGATIRTDREYATAWPLVTDAMSVGAAFLADASGILPIDAPNDAAVVLVGLVIGVLTQGGYNLTTGRGILGVGRTSNPT